MHDPVLVVLKVWTSRMWTRWLPGVFAVVVATESGSVAQAQAGSRGTWTFSTDSSNNLVIQDLEAFATATGRVGDTLCLQYHPACPSSSDRRANDLRLARPRYVLRGNGGGKGFEWRVEPDNPAVRDTGTTLPFLVGGVEQGMVQIVSSPGPWTIELQRIPASELRVGDGKRWNVFLRFAEAPADPNMNACWIEIPCP